MNRWFRLWMLPLPILLILFALFWTMRGMNKPTTGGVPLAQAAVPGGKTPPPQSAAVKPKLAASNSSAHTQAARLPVGRVPRLPCRLTRSHGLPLSRISSRQTRMAVALLSRLLTQIGLFTDEHFLGRLDLFRIRLQGLDRCHAYVYAHAHEHDNDDSPYFPGVRAAGSWR